MRILLTADPMLPVPPKLYGGIERIIDSLAVHLRRRGHEVALLAHRDSACAVDVLFAWPSGGGDTVRHAIAARRAIAAFRPDVVHSFSRLAYLALVLASRTLPKIMSFQREPTVRTVRLAERVARGSLTFTGCSDYISARGRNAGGRWQTIYNFVDVDQYTFRPSVPSTAPLVFLSRVEPIKGADLAIAACRAAGRRLLIAGNHSEADDESGRYWREKIEPHLDGDTVQYVGPVDDTQKNALLGGAAAMIVPIQWEEPFGIVFAEALACGTPVISCPRGALPEIVRHATDGILAKTRDELVAAISRLASIDRRNCRERAEQCFSARAIVPQYAELYAALVRV